MASKDEIMFPFSNLSFGIVILNVSSLKLKIVEGSYDLDTRICKYKLVIIICSVAL